MASLKLSECVCPICLCILVEPVTMPCQHELCMPCFRQNVEQANLTCPLCRLRISNWARKQAGKLVNEKRWKTIQDAFPDLCRQRLEKGEEDDDVLDLMTQPPPPQHNVAEPGEIGEEFKKEAEKLKQQYREQLEEAVRQSEAYIKELQKEEVRKVEQRRKEILRLEQQDAELARKLAMEGDAARTGFEEAGPSNVHQDAEIARRLAEEDSTRGRKSSQEEQDAELARRLAAEEVSDSVILLGEKVHVLKEQVMKDEELARRIQMSEEQSNSPPSKSPEVVIISSGSSSRKNSTSSIKCLRIENFLSPVSSKVRTSREDEPSTSAQTPTPEEEVIIVPQSTEAEKGKRKGAFSPVVLKAQRVRELDVSQLRAPSTDSNDSISAELNHFKPIHVSPRTAHRKLPDGRAESPPIIFTTPRNLNKTEFDDDKAKAPPPMSSFVQARWKELEEERSKQVNESSKSTMTSLSKHFRKQLSRHGKRDEAGSKQESKGEAPTSRKGLFEGFHFNKVEKPAEEGKVNSLCERKATPLPGASKREVPERRGESPCDMGKPLQEGKGAADKVRKGKTLQITSKGEPPQKRAKFDRLPSGDGTGGPSGDSSGDYSRRLPQKHPQGCTRVETDHKRREEKCVKNTLLHMRQVVQKDSMSSSSECSGDQCESTDYNHNVNNNKSSDPNKRQGSISDAKKLSSDVEERVSANRETSSSSCSTPTENVNRCASKESDGKITDCSSNGMDETDSVAPLRKKKVHTPIKEYSMRDQTKLQTRVTNRGIKDLLNAKMAKAKADTGSGVLPLPSADGGPGSDSKMKCTNRLTQEKLEQESVVVNNVVSDRSSCSKKVEVSYKEWLMSNGCKANSMQEVDISYQEWLSSNQSEEESMQKDAKDMGDRISQLRVSKCTKSVNIKDDKLSNRNCNGKGHDRTDDIGSDKGTDIRSECSNITEKDNMAMPSDDTDSSSYKGPSSQDSDVSMASVDVEAGGDKSHRKAIQRGKGIVMKENAKAKPARGSTKKNPRKSEDTILRYMQYLNEDQQRIAQEEQDRLLARRLQREFDLQMKKERDVNRSKGSDDAYMLRNDRRRLSQSSDSN